MLPISPYISSYLPHISQVLGLGGAMLGAAALASGWYPLPVALGSSLGGSAIEVRVRG